MYFRGEFGGILPVIAQRRRKNVGFWSWKPPDLRGFAGAAVPSPPRPSGWNRLCLCRFWQAFVHSPDCELLITYVGASLMMVCLLRDSDSHEEGPGSLSRL